MTAKRLTNDQWGLDTNCFVCEARNDSGLQLEIWVDEDEGMVWTDFSLGRAHSGVPTLVHGGLSLAILDEVQAWAVIALQHRWALTVETSARFKHGVRLDTTYRAVAQITGTDGDQITTRGRIETKKGLVCVDSSAVFQQIGEAVAEGLVGTELSDGHRGYTSKDDRSEAASPGDSSAPGRG